MFTQIYALTDPEEAAACVQAGADRIGVLVGDDQCGYPCHITEKTCREIFDAIDGKALKILISVRSDPRKIIEEAVRLHPDILHLCAEYTGDPGFREDLRKAAPDILLMEAVGVGSDYAAVDDAKKKAEYADILILDTVSPVVPGIGASGMTHDWNIDRIIVEQVNVPVVLAGGLGPDNVRQAIEKVHPAGVDSLTGTSYFDENGVYAGKNIEKVKQFCDAAKAFDL